MFKYDQLYNSYTTRVQYSWDIRTFSVLEKTETYSCSESPFASLRLQYFSWQVLSQNVVLTLLGKKNLV